MWQDVYGQFVAEQIHVNRTSWNNISQNRRIIAVDVATEDELNSDWFIDWDTLNDVERKSVESFDDCAQACADKRELCMQWQWETGRCYMGTDVRLGSADDREASTWESGWDTARIDEKTSRWSPCSLRWND